MKRCPICGKTKPPSEFNKDRTRSDGLQGRCRACDNNACSVSYKNNKDYYKWKRREWALKNPALCSLYVKRCRERKKLSLMGNMGE